MFTLAKEQVERKEKDQFIHFVFFLKKILDSVVFI